MNNKLILKKIFEYKGRMILSIINYSLGLLLGMVIFSIGLNISKNINSIIDDNPYFYNIYINSKSNDEDFSNIKEVEKLTNYRLSEYEISDFFGNDINIPIIEYDVSRDIIIPGKIISGELNLEKGNIILSKQFLNELNIPISDVVGRKIIDSNENEYLVVGIYDTDDVYSNFPCIIASNESFPLENIIIKVRDINDIKAVETQLKENNEVFSYSLEIKTIKNYSTIISIIFFIIGLLTLIVTAFILYTSISFSLKDKYSFIALLKSIGYKEKSIFKLVYFELIITSIISIILSIVLYLICLNCLDNFINIDKVFKNIKINVFSFNVLAVITSVIISMIILSLIALKSIKIITKINLLEILKEDNQ